MRFPAASRLRRRVRDVDRAHTCYLEDLRIPGQLTAETDLGGLYPTPREFVDPTPVLQVRRRTWTTKGTSRPELQAAVSSGFETSPDVRSIPTVTGWTLLTSTVGLELRAPDGSVFARSRTRPDPRWTSTASSRRSVVVMIGPRVRTRHAFPRLRLRLPAAVRRSHLFDVDPCGHTVVGVVPFDNRGR